MDAYVCESCGTVHAKWVRFCSVCFAEKRLRLETNGLTRQLLIQLLSTIDPVLVAEAGKAVGYPAATPDELISDLEDF